MKKITLSILAMCSFFGTVHSQANFTIVAPANNGSTSEFRAPNGTSGHAYQRTIMYLSAGELSPMTLSTINSFSFQYVKGTGSIPVAGNFTVYMQNTNDQTYLKGTNYATAVAPMQVVYNSTYTVPASVGAATVGVNLSSAFSYTGGGLYVAFDWESTGPFAVAGATYACNNTQTVCATADATAPGPAPNTLGVSAFRPSLIFKAVNTASNEITVTNIYADGKISKLFNTPQIITADVKNLGLNPQSNISVALTVGGANSFTDTKVISNLAVGAVETVTFTAFTTPNGGINTISVTSLFIDQLLTNNKKVWTQSVTCSEAGSVPPAANAAFLTTNAYGVGASGAGFVYCTEFTPSANVDLRGINLFVANFAQYNVGRPLTPVLLDNTGTVLSSGNTVNTTATMLGKWNVFEFVTPEPLTANTQYFIGVSLTTNTFYPMAILNNTYTSPADFITPGFYNIPVGGTSFNLLPIDYLGLEAALSFSSTVISVSASRTLVCKQDGEGSVTLTGTGAPSVNYTWTPGGQGASIVVSPTVAGTGGGVRIYNVAGTETVSGCRTNNSSITVSVSTCLSLSSNTSNGYDVKLFPNPSVNGKSTITGLVGINSITVYNTLGQVVFTQLVSDETTTIDLSAQPSGNYIVKITDSNSESRSIKVMNQN